MAIFSTQNAILDYIFTWNRWLVVCSFDKSRQADHFAVKCGPEVLYYSLPTRVCLQKSAFATRLLFVLTHRSKTGVTFYAHTQVRMAPLTTLVSSVLLFSPSSFRARTISSVCLQRSQLSVRHSTGRD